MSEVVDRRAGDFGHERPHDVIVADIRHAYGGVETLRGVSFSLSAGGTALVGVNGAGKSTLLSILSGGLKPSSGGRVLIGGMNPYGRAQRRAAVSRVAFMPQHFEAPRNLQALEAVTLIGWMRGMGWRDARSSAERSLDDVGLASRSRDVLGALSGGMVRRVALAQALVADPAVLLLDEPSTGLDPEQRRIMVNLIKGISAHRTVLFSSHIIEDVLDVAERVLVIDEGQLVFDGTVTQLEERAADGTEGTRAEAAFLGIVASRRSRR